MEQIKKLIAPLQRRVMLMIGRAVIKAARDDGGMQTVQAEALRGELRDGVERFQNYGFTSVPMPGAEAVLVSVMGNREHAIAIAVDDRRSRKKNLQPGEAAIYTDEGDYILLKRGKIIEVKAGNTVNVTAPAVNVIGNLSVTGNISASGNISADGGVSGLTVSDSNGDLSEIRTVYNSHDHNGAGEPPNQEMT